MMRYVDEESVFDLLYISRCGHEFAGTDSESARICI